MGIARILKTRSIVGVSTYMLDGGVMNNSSSMQMNVCADLGASELKVIYQIGNKQPCGMSLLPNILEVDSSLVSMYRQQQMSISEDIAWLKLKKSDTKVIAVDQLAENIFSLSNYKQLKINLADWRVLAIIGKIITIELEKLLAYPEEISLNLTVLLPFGESSGDSDEDSMKQDIKFFKRELKKKLKSFYHNDKKRIVKLENIRILPEGVGSLMCSPNHNITSTIVIMLGHRNTSYLYFNGDKFVNGDTTILGFHSFVKEFCSKTSGQEKNNLTTTTLWKSRLDLNELYRISKTDRLEYQAIELQTLKQAFLDGRAELWGKIKGWLLKELETIEFDKMQFTGGVAEFLQPLILEDEYFSNLPIEFAGSQYQETVKKSLTFPGLREEKINELSLRLVDCYGVFSGVFQC